MTSPCCMVAANLLVVLWLVLGAAESAESAAAAAAHKSGSSGDTKQQQGQDQHYFWNEITGDMQWEDPGDVAFEDDNNLRYWLSPNGLKLSEDPHMLRYTWMEVYSEDLQRTYYYNQETRESTWERPVDLAWRRIRVKLPS